MADGTVSINVPRSGAAPEDYEIGGAADFDLLAARAVYDGTGAAGDFLPAFQILNAAGQVMATVFGDTVTAGDSAEVTFAPFLRSQNGGRIGGDSRGVYGNGAGESIPDNTSQALSWTHVSGSDLLDLTVPTSPTAKVAGVYALTVFVLPTAVMTAGGYFQAGLVMNGAEGQTAERGFQVGAAAFPIVSLSLPWFVAAGANMQVSVQNKDGASARTFEFQGYLQLLR